MSKVVDVSRNTSPASFIPKPLCVKFKSWSIRESPHLNRTSFQIRDYLVVLVVTCVIYKSFKNFTVYREERDGPTAFDAQFITSFVYRYYNCLFPFRQKNTSNQSWFEDNFYVQAYRFNILNTWMLIISWLCVLFESSLLIICLMPSNRRKHLKNVFCQQKWMQG